MLPPSQQQALVGNAGYPFVTIGEPTTQNSSSNGKLWGSTVRRTMGIFQIICGVIEFALGITVIGLPLKYFYHDNVAWGVWNGVFAVIAGFFGVYSTRRKGMVIAYMVLSIIAAVMSGGCCISTSVATESLYYLHYSTQPRGGLSPYYDYGGYFGYDYARYYNRYNGYTYATAHFAIYIVLDVVFALQMLISILGACFTCGALYTKNSQQRIVYQLNVPALNQPFGPAPPYTAVATQGIPNNSAYNNPPYQQGTFVVGTTAVPTPTTGTSEMANNTT